MLWKKLRTLESQEVLDLTKNQTLKEKISFLKHTGSRISKDAGNQLLIVILEELLERTEKENKWTPG